ncbi:metallophosphoesterase [Rugosimonospora africana]|uniref:3',5'-cyclic adenosine monophosphate phosphodiesterase CpdA n=1 Tax=Rugosimonospora africana TaxID=556532 RepID=A0A8J3QS75_9ACTN|nr:metallophosphoesterase [Rugosimonospora africana]GIH14136.1 3',5'-cyclic adenosine monophosphate phosphodiesterase CpdA [Rugosimonospora africana]
MTVIAHLSDIHIGAGEHTAQRLDLVLRHLAAMPEPPDVVVVTGDIADHGRPAEYERVREMLALPVPVLFCPGNHDAREPFRTVLLDEPAAPGPVNRAHWVGDRSGSSRGVRRAEPGWSEDVVFALCDSTIPGRVDGLLADETLAWLDTVLAEAGPAPAFVCFHHPPVDLGQPEVDRIRQFGEERLVEVLSRHPSVVAMLCGHAHTPAASRLAGVPVLVAPGVASTVMLAGESHWPARALPPGLAFHVLHDDRRLTTHYRTVT